MYLTVRKYRNVQGDRKQLMEKVSNGFVPLISKIDGFVDYYCILTDDNSLLSVSVYRDAKGAEESVRTAKTFVEENLAQHLPEKPELISGDVFAHPPMAKQKAA